MRARILAHAPPEMGQQRQRGKPNHSQLFSQPRFAGFGLAGA
jgi:hypothetical protein